MQTSMTISVTIYVTLRIFGSILYVRILDRWVSTYGGLRPGGGGGGGGVYAAAAAAAACAHAPKRPVYVSEWYERDSDSSVFTATISPAGGPLTPS